MWERPSEGEERNESEPLTLLRQTTLPMLMVDLRLKRSEARGGHPRLFRAVP
jgi:hypothetical protein